MVSKQTEFKGNPIIELRQNENDDYPFSFGIKKAKLIIEHIDDIKEFIKDNE